MKIAKIINNSSAEVHGHFSDVIYFQGCNRTPPCPYCFNPDLIPIHDGKEMSKYDVINSLSDLSDVVVITGGEPLDQGREVYELIAKIKEVGYRRVVLETSLITMVIFNGCDKILFTFKTFDILDDIDIKYINQKDNIIPCVVIGHKWFDFGGYKKILKGLKKPLFYRFYNGRLQKFNEVFRMAKVYNVELKKFDKIEID